MSAQLYERDLRIDFFRGLALLFIFIDHIPDNGFGHLTLRNFGFADAAEVFVFLAGFSAVLAYSKTFNTEGFLVGASRVIERACQLYVWHLGVVIASLMLLSSAAVFFAYPEYLLNIGLHFFIETPLKAFSETGSLFHQPNMLNILPVYIVLMAWFPVMYWLLRKSHALALAVAFSIWGLASLYQVNFPSKLLPDTGWFLNPFAWQLLMTAGAVMADRVISNKGVTPLVSKLLMGLAVSFLGFAFIYAAPWTHIPGLQDLRLIPADFLGYIDKSYLSLWRLAHLLALVYVVAKSIPHNAAWLKRSWAEAVSRCGRHSLEIFSFGIILSFTGWIIYQEVGSGLLTQCLVNIGGVLLLGGMAWYLAISKQRKKTVVMVQDPVPAESTFWLRPWQLLDLRSLSAQMPKTGQNA